MDLLDRLLGHDTWTTQQLLARCEGLTDEQLDREFDLGHRSVRATLVHVVRNVEVWADLMSGRPVRDRGDAQRCTIPALAARRLRAAEDLRGMARAIADGDAWDELWIDHFDRPPRANPTAAASCTACITEPTCCTSSANSACPTCLKETS